MDTPSYEELEKKMNNFNLQEWKFDICINIKNERRKLEKKYKESYKDTLDPFKIDHSAEILNINTSHLKHIESNNPAKRISLDMIVKCSILYNCNISDLIKKK